MELVLVGSVNAEFENDCIKVTTPCTFERKKNVLTIKGKSNVYTVGNVCVGSRGNVYQSVNGNVNGVVGNVYVAGNKNRNRNGNVYQSIGDNYGTAICGNNISVTGGVVASQIIMGNGNIVSMNGDMHVDHNNAGNGENVGCKLTIIELSENDVFNSVVLKGSGVLHVSGNKISSSFSATLEGSGGINLFDLMLNFLNLNLMGSGDIKANNVNVEQINANLMGSGDIKGFKVNAGSLTLMGSGDIRVKSKNPNLRKSRMGSGSIIVTSS